MTVALMHSGVTLLLFEFSFTISFIFLLLLNFLSAEEGEMEIQSRHEIFSFMTHFPPFLFFSFSLFLIDFRFFVVVVAVVGILDDFRSFKSTGGAAAAPSPAPSHPSPNLATLFH